MCCSLGLCNVAQSSFWGLKFGHFKQIFFKQSQNLKSSEFRPWLDVNQQRVWDYSQTWGETWTELARQAFRLTAISQTKPQLNITMISWSFLKDTGQQAYFLKKEKRKEKAKSNHLGFQAGYTALSRGKLWQFKLAMVPDNAGQRRFSQVVLVQYTQLFKRYI